MLRIGLTGGIGAGKSTVAQVLSALGGVVLDADRFAREAVAPGAEGLAAVVAEFGPDVLAADGALDRAALGRLVFADAGRRAALEAITHPLVAQRTARAVAAAPPDAIVVHDVPLIVEKAMGALYHLVLVVDAPEQVRLQRLVDQRGMAAGDAAARIAAQAGYAQRRAAADVWLDNDRPLDAVRADLERLWHERLRPFEQNVRTRTRVRRPDDIGLVPADPAWPAAAARLSARVRRAAGPRGVAVEHIGSTAVPGLAAKPVIDLQLGVRSLADADAIADDLADAGFPPSPGTVGDDVHPDVAPDPASWRKRFHGGADPAVLVHLHVREHGGPGWRTALMLRDFWRAVPAERERNAESKLALRGASPDASAYADAKAAGMAATVRRAVDWAARTSWQPGA